MPEELKGKAVQVEHFLYDELWNMGPKKIPDEIHMIAKTGGGVIEEDKVESEEIKQEEPVKPKTTPEVTVVEEEEKKASEILAEASDTIEIEDGPKVSPEDMDARFVEAFYRSLMESVNDSMMPMEPSDF